MCARDVERPKYTCDRSSGIKVCFPTHFPFFALGTGVTSLLPGLTDLFKAQCHDRIEPSGAAGRIETKRNPDEAGKSASQDDCPWADQDRPAGFQCDCDGSCRPEERADKSSDQGQHQGFDQELPSDVAWPCTYRYSQSDFAGAFGH